MNDNRRRAKKKRKERRVSRQDQGTKKVLDDKVADNQKYDLSWFKPIPEQKEVIYNLCCKDLTLVQGSSGCGKSTTAIHYALDSLDRGHTGKIFFLKTPSEDADDMVGYLKGGLEEKLEPHFESMKSIFHTFMTKSKLEMDIKRGKVEFIIPNYLAGKTLDNCILIIDEAQKISPSILKLCIERAGKDTQVIVLGDKCQRYSSKKRDDGFTDLVKKVTEMTSDGRESVYDSIGYVELTSRSNMRSDLSKLIVQIYEEGEE